MTKTQFTDSSKDYLENSILILFEGPMPSPEEVQTYCKRLYGEARYQVEAINPESGYLGFTNPGSCYVKIL